MWYNQEKRDCSYEKKKDRSFGNKSGFSKTTKFSRPMRRSDATAFNHRCW